MLAQSTGRKGHCTVPTTISAGSMVPNATDLLMSQRMRELIAELRGEFDYIVANGAV